MSRCHTSLALPAPLLVLLLFVLLCAGGATAGLSFDVSPPKSSSSSSQFSIGSALRYLSKAIFVDALVGVDDLDSIEGHLRSANTQDSSDCVKKLICELHSSKGDPLSWDEELIRQAVDNRIDYSSPFVQFQLAADLGQKQPEQCSVVFSRCAFSRTDIMDLMRQRGTSLDIKTNDDYDCTVLFLWNKKLKVNKKEEEAEEPLNDQEEN